MSKASEVSNDVIGTDTKTHNETGSRVGDSAFGGVAE